MFAAAEEPQDNENDDNVAYMQGRFDITQGTSWTRGSIPVHGSESSSEGATLTYGQFNSTNPVIGSNCVPTNSWIGYPSTYPSYWYYPQMHTWSWSCSQCKRNNAPWLATCPCSVPTTAPVVEDESKVVRRCSKCDTFYKGGHECPDDERYVQDPLFD